MSMCSARSSASQSRACASEMRVEPSNGMRANCQTAITAARISHLDRQRVAAAGARRRAPPLRRHGAGRDPRAARRATRPAPPWVDRGEREQRDERARERVREVVVAGLRHGQRHQHRMRTATARSQARRSRGRPCRRQDAPADVQARHGRIRVEAHARERAAVVAGEADGVGDAETRTSLGGADGKVT